MKKLKKSQRIVATTIYCSCFIFTHSAHAICNTEELTARPHIPESTPNSQLQDNGDYTITDTSTGLMWMQCSQGQTNDSNCSGSANDYTWLNALISADMFNSDGGFAGYNDWRLPNIKELRSIVEVSCVGPSINEDRFPNTELSPFWTSSPYSDDAAWSWSVSFIYGTSDGSWRGQERLIRLVREAE